jgi:hypothetical protein
MEHSIRYAHAGSRESRQSYHSKVEHRWCSSNWLADVIGLGLSTWVSNTMWLLVDETQKSNTLLSPLIRRIPTPNPALLESVPDELTWGYPPGGKREVSLCLPLPCPCKGERFCISKSWRSTFSIGQQCSSSDLFMPQSLHTILVYDLCDLVSVIWSLSPGNGI